MSRYSDKNEKIDSNPMKEVEDTTKYGEFVSSYFSWLTLEEQKEKAKKMQEMTKGKN